MEWKVRVGSGGGRGAYQCSAPFFLLQLTHLICLPLLFLYRCIFSCLRLMMSPSRLLFAIQTPAIVSPIYMGLYLPYVKLGHHNSWCHSKNCSLTPLLVENMYLGHHCTVSIFIGVRGNSEILKLW